MATVESAIIDTEKLLSDLRTSATDLWRLVAAVLRDRSPYVVVPRKAVTAWEQREPRHWARVSEWLAAHNVDLVTI
jgi:hypothetical protein